MREAALTPVSRKALCPCAPFEAAHLRWSRSTGATRTFSAPRPVGARARHAHDRRPSGPARSRCACPPRIDAADRAQPNRSGDPGCRRDAPPSRRSCWKAELRTWFLSRPTRPISTSWRACATAPWCSTGPAGGALRKRDRARRRHRVRRRTAPVVGAPSLRDWLLLRRHRRRSAPRRRSPWARHWRADGAESDSFCAHLVRAAASVLLQAGAGAGQGAKSSLVLTRSRRAQRLAK